MDPRRRASSVAALLVALAAAFLLGRSTAPAKVEMRERTVEAKTTEAAKQEQHANSTSTIKLEGAVITRTVTKTIPAPGCAGPVTERTTERYATKQEQRQEQKQASGRQEATRTAEARIVERVRVVTANRASWAVGADGGLRFIDASLLVRGSVEIRAIGPMWIGAWADVPVRGQPLAAGLRARVEF